MTLVHFCHAMFGMPNSGKSTLLKYLIGEVFDDFKTAYLFSNTCFTNDWEDIFPNQNIYPDYNEDVLALLVSNARRISERGKQPPNILLIFDDCICNFRKNEIKILKEIILHRRHLQISIIISTQYIKDNPPFLRNNIDYIYIFAQKTQSGIGVTHESISGILDKKPFKKIITSLKDHAFLACNYQTGMYEIMKVELPILIRQFKIIKQFKI